MSQLGKVAFGNFKIKKCFHSFATLCRTRKQIEF